MNEARITINGTELTPGQCMTIRVALANFLCDLQDGLGDDEHGRYMTEQYKLRIAEIERLMRV